MLEADLHLSDLNLFYLSHEAHILARSDQMLQNKINMGYQYYIIKNIKNTKSRYMEIVYIFT